MKVIEYYRANRLDAAVATPDGRTLTAARPGERRHGGPGRAEGEKEAAGRG